MGGKEELKAEEENGAEEEATRVPKKEGTEGGGGTGEGTDGDGEGGGE